MIRTFYKKVLSYNPATEDCTTLQRMIIFHARRNFIGKVLAHCSLIEILDVSSLYELQNSVASTSGSAVAPL
jgi:hypothetical protein